MPVVDQENKLRDMPPEDFNEEEKKEFSYLLTESRIRFPESEDFILRIACEAHVRKQSSEYKQASKDEIKLLKEKYLKYTFDEIELAKRPFECKDKIEETPVEIIEDKKNEIEETMLEKEIREHIKNSIVIN